MRSSPAWLAAALWFATAALPAEPPDEVLDEILVIGEQPGPGLWKVTKGDHVMWVLASQRQLSQRMTWRPQQVQARIAGSQEVLYPPDLDIHPSIGILHAVTLLPSLLKAGKNPDGASLRQVLPPDLYAKWLVARDKYMAPKDVKDLEEWRPEVAIAQLRSAAFARNGLFRGVDRLVRDTAKKNKVPIHRLPTLDRAVKVENPRGMLKSVRKLQQSDLACFTRSLDSIEPDIELAKARANAWSRGDIPKLRELNRDSQRSQDQDCLFALAAGFTASASADAARAKKILADFQWHAEQGRVQSQRDWLVAAQKALEKNSSTFAVLPVEDVLRPDGHLEKLRALGYTVEEPL